MEFITPTCIFIDQESPLWPHIQSYLEANGRGFTAPTGETAPPVPNGKKKKGLEQRVRELLQYMGVPTHVYGFTYLTGAIQMAYHDADVLHRVTKDLYPALAKMYHSTGSRVERNIRQAIIIAWRAKDLRHLKPIFKCEAPAKPYNSEFISTAACYLRGEDAQAED